MTGSLASLLDRGCPALFRWVFCVVEEGGMTRLLLAVAGLFSLSHADVQVTELFRAETPEDLEVALVDGYPMPWLAEVLADSTIPEEDRYWLDCRMRVAIAQELHLFFDLEGNRVEVEAEWIAPGEDYWRENMMVNLLEEGEAEEEQRTPMFRSGGHALRGGGAS
jgi:hypothetical protein